MKYSIVTMQVKIIKIGRELSMIQQFEISENDLGERLERRRLIGHIHDVTKART